MKEMTDDFYSEILKLAKQIKSKKKNKKTDDQKKEKDGKNNGRR